MQVLTVHQVHHPAHSLQIIISLLLVQVLSKNVLGALSARPMPMECTKNLAPIIIITMPEVTIFLQFLQALVSPLTLVQ